MSQTISASGRTTCIAEPAMLVLQNVTAHHSAG